MAPPRGLQRCPAAQKLRRAERPFPRRSRGLAPLLRYAAMGGAGEHRGSTSAKFGPTPAKTDLDSADSGPNSATRGPSLANIIPNLADSGQIRANLVERDPTSADFAQIWPGDFEVRSLAGNSGRSGQAWPTFGRSRAKLGPIRPKFGPDSGELWHCDRYQPSSGENGAARRVEPTSCDTSRPGVKGSMLPLPMKTSTRACASGIVCFVELNTILAPTRHLGANFGQENVYKWPGALCRPTLLPTASDGGPGVWSHGEVMKRCGQGGRSTRNLKTHPDLI